ncbi:unnamed protein product [Somion occarium]|uniref:Uncharacterized protein n=1 Tax=Somion occarium TaxID=3059160 RepID=A0ABP1E7G2_9APHY
MDKSEIMMSDISRRLIKDILLESKFIESTSTISTMIRDYRTRVSQERINSVHAIQGFNVIRLSLQGFAVEYRTLRNVTRWSSMSDTPHETVTLEVSKSLADIQQAVSIYIGLFIPGWSFRMQALWGKVETIAMIWDMVESNLKDVEDMVYCEIRNPQGKVLPTYLRLMIESHLRIQSPPTLFLSRVRSIDEDQQAHSDYIRRLQTALSSSGADFQGLSIVNFASQFPATSYTGANARLIPAEYELGINRESEEKLRREVRQLTADTLSIDSSFESISCLLREVGNCKGNLQLSANAQRLGSTWIELRKKYTTLLWQSREVAGYASAAAEDFADVFIDTVLLDRDIGFTQMKEEISKCKETAYRHNARAKSIVDGFERLKIEVEHFYADWLNCTQKCRPSDKRSKEHIAKTEAALYRLKFKIVSIYVAVGLLFAAAGAVTVVLAIHGVAGVDILGVVTSDALKSRIISVREALRDKHSSLKQRIRDINTEQDNDSRKTMSDFQNIATKLGAIASIWSNIVGDLSEVESMIDLLLCTSEQPEMYDIFVKRLRGMRDVYATLGSVFREYQVAVSRESPQFKDIGKPSRYAF